MKFVNCVAATAALCLSSSAFAQTALVPVVAPPAPVAVAPVAPAGTAILRTGTPVSLKLLEELTTKKKVSRVGQRFRLEVIEDVKVDGVTVIPVGSPAMGEITSVKNKGMWGKSGHLGAQLLYTQVNGRQIRLSGTFDDKGVSGTGAVVGAVLLMPIAGFFTTGTSALIPMGASIKGFVNEDVALAFETIAPAPLAVPVQAAPMAAPTPALTTISTPVAVPAPK